jgi:hypothetical protein
MLFLYVLLPITLPRLCFLPTLLVSSADPRCDGIPLRTDLDLALVPWLLSMLRLILQEKTSPTSAAVTSAAFLVGNSAMQFYKLIFGCL